MHAARDSVMTIEEYDAWLEEQRAEAEAAEGVEADEDTETKEAAI